MDGNTKLGGQKAINFHYFQRKCIKRQKIKLEENNKICYLTRLSGKTNPSSLKKGKSILRMETENRLMRLATATHNVKIPFQLFFKGNV